VVFLLYSSLKFPRRLAPNLPGADSPYQPGSRAHSGGFSPDDGRTPPWKCDHKADARVAAGLGLRRGAIVGLIFLALAWNVNVAIAAAVICVFATLHLPTAAGIASTYFPKFRHHLRSAHGCVHWQHDLPARLALLQERSGSNRHLADCGKPVVLFVVQSIFVRQSGSRARNRALRK